MLICSYQYGPDTYLLQVKDATFPARLREYLNVARTTSADFQDCKVRRQRGLKGRKEGSIIFQGESNTSLEQKRTSAETHFEMASCRGPVVVEDFRKLRVRDYVFSRNQFSSFKLGMY